MTDRVRLVAGIGFRHAATVEEIVDLIGCALAEAGLAPDALAAIATAADRAGEDVCRAAAAAFGLEPVAVSPDALRAANARVVTRSERIAASRGVGSVAEAAALAAAGPGARLVLPRIASPAVTCALASPAVPGVSGRA